MNVGFACDGCRWYQWAYLNAHWYGHLCLAPDYQHEMPKKKAIRDGEEPEEACRHFAAKERGVES